MAMDQQKNPFANFSRGSTVGMVTLVRYNQPPCQNKGLCYNRDTQL